MRPSPAIATTPPALNTRLVRRVASRRSFLAGLYGIVAPLHVIRRLRPPTLISSSLGPKKYSLGWIGSTAIRMNGSIQFMWLKQ
jgi:hypothetical protein